MLSSLCLIQTCKILVHEAHEELRLEKIKSAILSQGYVSHPILVIRTTSDRYLVIDGAHRFQALSSIGCTKIPVQIINPDNIILSTWEHEVLIGPWLENIRSDTGWEWQSKLKKTEWTACLVDESGCEYWLVPVKQPTNLIDRLSNWHKIVNSYVNAVSVNRLSLNSNRLPVDGYIRFRFPAWTITDIENVVMAGEVLPAGTTQFIVQKRMLNLRIPLYLLTSLVDCTNEWEQQKKDWSTSLRYYPGGVYLNDI